MRRILISCTVAGALTFAVLSVSPNRAAAQGKAKTKTVAATKAVAPPTYGNSDAITEDTLKNYLYFLASDQLEGRNFPSRGYDTAALFVASHLNEWGFQPGGSTSGTNGPLQPYLMPIELVSRQIVPDESKLSITAPPAPQGRGFGGGGGQGRGRGGRSSEPVTTNFEYGKEWTVGGGGRGASANALKVSGKLVFAGNGYVINKTNTDPYSGLDVKGKIIVVAGLPAELEQQQGGGRGGRGAGRGQGGNNAAATGGTATAQPPAGAAAGRGGPNPLGEPCIDYYSPEQYAAKNGALAVITIPNFQQLTAMGAGGRGGRGGNLNGPPYSVVKFATPGACPSAPNISAGLELTNAIFQGEKMNGSQVFYGAGTNAKLDSFALRDVKTISIDVAVKSEPGHGENVVGILEGSDPVLKNEYVLLSAHLDHIGLAQPQPDGHAVNNGADDDGSGSVGLLGVARAYAEGAAKGIHPKRSIIFLWNGGEEKGLWGSQYFAEFPPIDLSKVVADLNMDMIGRSKNPNSVDSDPTHFLVEQGEVLVVGPNVSSDDLGHTIDGVNGNYQKLKINHFYDTTAPDATHDNLGPQPRGQRIFYRSDHYNFAKMGIPIAFFTIGLHVDYHRPSDTPEKIDYKELQMIAKTVSAVGWELANQAGRPKLNEKLPEQLEKDMKTVQSEGWGKVTPVLPPLPGMPY